MPLFQLARTVVTFGMIAFFATAFVFVSYRVGLFYYRVFEDTEKLEAGHIIVTVIFLSGLILSPFVCFALAKAWSQEMQAWRKSRKATLKIMR